MDQCISFQVLCSMRYTSIIKLERKHFQTLFLSFMYVSGCSSRLKWLISTWPVTGGIISLLLVSEILFFQFFLGPWRRFPGSSAGKNRPVMWETWVCSLGWEDSLEKGKATHSTLLAWRISMGLQTVRHDWATFTFEKVPWKLSTTAVPCEGVM